MKGITKYLEFLLGLIYTMLFFFIYFIRERITQPIMPLQQTFLDYLILLGNVILLISFCIALFTIIRHMLNYKPSWLSKMAGKAYTNLFLNPLEVFSQATVGRIPGMGKLFRKTGKFVIHHFYYNNEPNFRRLFALALILDIIPRMLLLATLYVNIIGFGQFNYFLLPVIILGIYLLFFRVIVCLIYFWCRNNFNIASQIVTCTDGKFSFRQELPLDYQEEEKEHLTFYRTQYIFYSNLLNLTSTFYNIKGQILMPYLSLLLTSIFCLIWLNVCLIRLNILLPTTFFFVSTMIIIIIITIIFAISKIYPTKKISN